MNRIPSSPHAAASPRRILLLGRAPGNDLVVKAPSVSARHARVVVDEEGLWLEDLGSRNGTFVGVPPRRVERERIDVADTITLGNARLRQRNFTLSPKRGGKITNQTWKA